MGIDKKEVGRRIRRIRKEKGMNQSDFGKEVDNAHKGLVSRWESGVNLPNNERLKKIAELGGMTVDELLNALPTPSGQTQIIIKQYDRTLSVHSISAKQAEQVENYIQLLKTGKGRFPSYVSDMVDRHNVVASYYGGTNPND